MNVWILMLLSQGARGDASLGVYPSPELCMQKARYEMQFGKSDKSLKYGCKKMELRLNADGTPYLLQSQP